MSRPDRIRTLTIRTLQQMGASGTESDLNETLLIRGGSYCGHRYELADYQAVWFVEEDQIKFYGPSGDLLENLQPSKALVELTTQPPQERAA